MKHTSTTSIIEINPLNRPRSIKLYDALTQTFMESEATIVYINEIKEEAYNKSLISIRSP